MPGALVEMTSLVEDFLTPLKQEDFLQEYDFNSNKERKLAPNLGGAVCCGCSLPITDRFLMRVAENSWHESCVKCAACGQQLEHSCFVKDGRLLCRNDYNRMYTSRLCSGCSQLILSPELVMRVGCKVYHITCFQCYSCRRILNPGDEYGIHRLGYILCRPDYDREVLYSMEGWYTGPYNSDCDSIMDENDLDGSKGGPKRPRTILTTTQRRKFKQAFEVNPKPCRKVREQLANETGLSVRVVQVWFQNQRAKMKKIARKQQQQQKESQTEKSKSASHKEDSESDSESDATSGRTTSQHACADDRDVTALELPPSDPASSTNPIDKLYSMSNTYFEPNTH